MIGQYYTYQEGEARNRAISVPAINRARDLMASVISCMPLKMYNEVWNELEEEMTKVYLAPRSWLRRPDPTVPYGHIMAWTFDDLFFYGRAFWYITSRTASRREVSTIRNRLALSWMRLPVLTRRSAITPLMGARISV